MALIENLINKGYLKTVRLIDAFRAIRRRDFLPINLPNRDMLAELDEAISIGFAQTISQPAVVAFMLELLSPQPGQKILDIGYGSGWTTALLAYIASGGGAAGKVVAIERIPELALFGRNNISKYNFINRKIVRYVVGDGSRGYWPQAPYDRILASAAATSIPKTWIKQLKIGGIIVAPQENAIVKITKNSQTITTEERHEGFAFVPLVQGNGKNNRIKS
ncbi:MAG: protein-L-isoaspartate O-methyltransferase [Minisyncoccales bacterium]